MFNDMVAWIDSPNLFELCQDASFVGAAAACSVFFAPDHLATAVSKTCQNQVYKPKVKPCETYRSSTIVQKRSKMNPTNEFDCTWLPKLTVRNLSFILFPESSCYFMLFLGRDYPFPDTNPGIFTLDHKLLLRTGAIYAHGGQLRLRFLKHLLP